MVLWITRQARRGCEIHGDHQRGIRDIMVQIMFEALENLRGFEAEREVYMGEWCQPIGCHRLSFIESIPHSPPPHDCGRPFGWPAFGGGLEIPQSISARAHRGGWCQPLGWHQHLGVHLSLSPMNVDLACQSACVGCDGTRPTPFSFPLCHV